MFSRAISEILDKRDQRDQLTGEYRPRFDAQIIGVSERFKRAGKEHSEPAEIPTRQPDALPKKTWRKKGSPWESYS